MIDIATAFVAVLFHFVNCAVEIAWPSCCLLSKKLLSDDINVLGRQPAPQTVVIIGASFAGLECARDLHDRGFHIIVIDFKEYFEYTPGVLRAVVDSKGLSEITCDFKQAFKNRPNITFVKGRVCKICVDENSVEVALCDGGGEEISFDYLVCAFGTKYSMDWLKAGNYHQESTLNGRRKVLEEIRLKLVEAESVLILGGGLTGVELAAEIMETWPKKSVTLVNGPKQLLPTMPNKTQNYVTKWFSDRGINVSLGKYVKECVQNGGKYQCTLADGQVIPADLILSCMGNSAQDDFSSLFQFENKDIGTGDWLDHRGMLRLNDALQLDCGRGHVYERVFCCGDAMGHEGGVHRMKAKILQPRGYAQSAERSAAFVAHNITNMGIGKPLLSWPLHLSGVIPTMFYVVSLGKYDAVMGVLGNDFVLGGFPAAFMKWLVQFLKVKEYEGSILAEAFWKVNYYAMKHVCPMLFPLNPQYKDALKQGAS